MSGKERRIYGLTGQTDRDGFLTEEQQRLLDEIQDHAAYSCLEYLSHEHPVDPFPMVAMATGIGKGKIIHKIIEGQVEQKPDSKILLVAGTKVVLVEQSHEALAQYVESEDDDQIIPETIELEDIDLNGGSYLYKTGRIGEDNANVHVATIQSVQSEFNNGNLNPENYDLVIVDEVHNIGTKKRKSVIQKFNNVVGLTATPFRHSGKMKKPEDYGFTVVDSLPLPDAQELRLLPPLLGMQIDTKAIVDTIPMTADGNIDFKALEQVLKSSPELRPYIAERVAKIISSEGNQYKTVIAVNFVWEAQELARLLKEKGITVGVAVNKRAAKEIHTEEIPAIDSVERYKLPKEDERSVQVLISPYVASEGFDAPFTEVLVWASPTDSSLRYTQYTGRLARRNLGKRFGVIVDCLYQTNQYNWSYNMGMWMKDNVKQLENGLLWLGPASDIEEIKKLSIIQRLKNESDLKNITELQKEDERLLGVQEGDFIITAPSLRTVFAGRRSSVMELAREVVDQIKQEDASQISKRKYLNKHVTVVTDKDLFIRLMKEKGAVLKNLQIEEDWFVITDAIIKDKFSGNSAKISAAAKKVLAHIKTVKPSLVSKVHIDKGNRTARATVVKDKKYFIDLMAKEGIKLKEEHGVLRESDFVISRPELKKVFKGHHSRIGEISDSVVKKLLSQNPSIFVTRRRPGRSVLVCTDRELFIKTMIENGAELQDVDYLKEGELPIRTQELRDLFIGGGSEIYELRDHALSLIKEHYPDKVVQRKIQRKKGVSYVTAVTDKQLFIDAMIKVGAKLR